VGVCSRSTCVYRRGGLEVRSSLTKRVHYPKLQRIDRFTGSAGYIFDAPA